MERYIRFGSSNRRLYRRLIGFAGLLWLPVVGWADDWLDTLQVHGFLSQGYVESTDNRWFGPSDRGSWDLREIGLNASVRPAPDWHLAAQALSRTAGDMDDGSLRLDYGLVDWTFLPGAEQRAGLRLGRVKNPLGFYNETRDVAFTRPGIFLPQSVYFDRVRNLMLASDGVQAYADWHLDAGDISLQLNVGYPQIDKNVEYTFLGRDWDGNVAGDHLNLAGQLAFEDIGGRFRGALSVLTARIDFERGAADPPPPVLDSGTIDIRGVIASVQYNADDWTLTGEYLYQEVDWSNLGTLFTRWVPAEGYYVQGNYRFLPVLDGFLRYGVRYADSRDKDGTRQASRFGTPPHAGWAKDWTAGIRWDVTSDIMLRAEYQWVDGTAWLSNRENGGRPTERFWNMFSVLASFRF